MISIIIPFYNEENALPLIYAELLKIFQGLKEKYDYELIFIDDGSEDKSPEILEGLTGQNNKVKYIQFSRNFGKEIAVSAGLQNVSGDAAILIDADLQHPPELISEFLQKWKNGADIVVGMRKNYKQSRFRKFCSYIFYKVQNAISDIKILPNETDYRLLARKVVDEFNKFTERGRIVRGLLNWLGFKKEYVYFSVPERKFDKVGYNFPKLARLAIATLVSHSLLPLKLAGYLGLSITFLFGAAGFLLFVGKYIFNNSFARSFSGSAQLAILIIFLIGLVLSCLGFMALYIANIQNEVTNRPLYIIKKKKNIND